MSSSELRDISYTFEINVKHNPNCFHHMEQRLLCKEISNLAFLSLTAQSILRSSSVMHYRVSVGMYEEQ